MAVEVSQMEEEFPSRAFHSRRVFLFGRQNQMYHFYFEVAFIVGNCSSFLYLSIMKMYIKSCGMLQKLLQIVKCGATCC